jgi:hypothetical protein
MATKPVKSLNDKALSGELIEPIDTGLFMPLWLEEPLTPEHEDDWRRYLLAKDKELRHLRMAKMPALARHLGIDVEALNLGPANGTGWALLYAAVAEKLTAELIPGFQEKSRGEWPREFIHAARLAIDTIKEKTRISDFDACMQILQQAAQRSDDPDEAKLAKAKHVKELKAKAKQMMNRISKDRQSAKKPAQHQASQKSSR